MTENLPSFPAFVFTTSSLQSVLTVTCDLGSAVPGKVSTEFCCTTILSVKNRGKVTFAEAPPAIIEPIAKIVICFFINDLLNLIGRYVWY